LCDFGFRVLESGIFLVPDFFSGIRKISDSVFHLVILHGKNSGIRIFSGSRIFSGINRIPDSGKKRKTPQIPTTSLFHKFANRAEERDLFIDLST
jgi:hypothetical protein